MREGYREAPERSIVLHVGGAARSGGHLSHQRLPPLLSVTKYQASTMTEDHPRFARPLAVPTTCQQEELDRRRDNRRKLQLAPASSAASRRQIAASNTAGAPKTLLLPSSNEPQRKNLPRRIPRRAAKIAVHITNPIFPCKSLDYREISKPIYVVNRPLSAAFQPPKCHSIPHDHR